MIVGERVLRDGVDDFYNIIKGGVEYYTEPGGIHAGLVYVECLDYISKQGAEKNQGVSKTSLHIICSKVY